MNDDDNLRGINDYPTYVILPILNKFSAEFTTFQVIEM
jgi:hypothetical protein